ncbi:PucR family transcriptional regulator [Mycobacterium sp. smrl_JER01]|uniref:PucR family transcriptional regulator n=1 Tax=Mycobacterium sp. smrl_JER01 TaxID=3402633 RepID=UPI003AC2AC26
MNAHSAVADDSEAAGLAALARLNFSSLDPAEILKTAADGAETLCPCRLEASYRAGDGSMTLCPPTQSERPELTETLLQLGWKGRIEFAHRDWGQAFPLVHRDVVHGCLVLGAAAEPTTNHLLLLDVLAQRAGAALACAELHLRDVRRARELEDANEELADAVRRLNARTRAHELLEAALAAGTGAEGVAEALHRLTGCSVSVEDKFGNLLAWSGPGRPLRYPKPRASERDQLLRMLSAQPGPLYAGNRISVLIRPHAEILGVVALVDTGDAVDEDQLFALRYGTIALGLELSHRRSLAEMQLNLRRELVDDLLAGTDANGAYARAEAMGYDLRRPHYVVVIHSGRGAAKSDIRAVSRAAANLHIDHLVGQQEGLVVVLVVGHPGVSALHKEVSRQLGHPASAIGIGSLCEVPEDFPQSFLRARRAANVRLNSANPHGASDYDDLGFYHLVDAAHSARVADEYVRQWLGPLIDYDAHRSSDLVHTLIYYLECGGNYDESAAALHIHRSTLRYRLGRIADLTGLDLRDVDTRFNLHAATRVWRFLTPDRLEDQHAD